MVVDAICIDGTQNRVELKFLQELGVLEYA